MTAPDPTAAALARWREVEQAATNGPWVEHYGDVRTAHTPATSKRPERQSMYLAEWVIDADAVFAATARTAVPALLAMAEAVLALHPRAVAYGVDVCATCSQVKDADEWDDPDDSPIASWLPWPCPTVTAIATAIGGAR